MKLYDLHRGAKFKVLETPIVPPDVLDLYHPDDVYTLGNIDGMYSNSRDLDGNMYYFGATTEVEEVTNG